MACGILVPWPGIEPASPAVEAQTLNHWTTSKVPSVFILFDFSSIYHTPSFSGLSSSVSVPHTLLNILLPFCVLPLSSSAHSASSHLTSIGVSQGSVCSFSSSSLICQMAFISHLCVVCTPAYITSRFSVPDRSKTELWLPPLPAPNLFLPLVPSHQLMAAQSIWLLKSPHRSNPWFPVLPSLPTTTFSFSASHVISPLNILWVWPFISVPFATLAQTFSFMHGLFPLISSVDLLSVGSPCSTETPEIV